VKWIDIVESTRIGSRFLSVDSILTSARVPRFLKATVISANGSCLCLVVVGRIDWMSDARVFSNRCSCLRGGELMRG
jgi:hypothetical protein